MFDIFVPAYTLLAAVLLFVAAVLVADKRRAKYQAARQVVQLYYDRARSNDVTHLLIPRGVAQGTFDLEDRPVETVKVSPKRMGNKR